MTDKVASNISQATGVRYAGRRITVVDPDDVAYAEGQFDAGAIRKPFSIRLRPQPNLLRSEDFLNRVAMFSVKAGVPVELEGSILSHC